MLLCVCVIVRVHFHYVFLVCFQSGGGGGGKRKGWTAAVAATVLCGKEIHWPWEMEIVSKTFFLLLFFFQYGYSKTITVTISYLTVIMISDCTRRDLGFLQTVVPTQRTTCMGLKTSGPCPSRVSDIAVK